MPIIPVVADMNHANSVNFTKIKAAGIWGIIHKARQGIGFGDPAYASRRAAAEQLGLLWGAYDFATHDNVAENVKDFLDTAKPYANTLMALDFEDNTKSEMTGAQALEFLDRVNQTLGRATWLYGGNRIREQIDHQDARWIDAAEVTPLWLCQYKSGISRNGALGLGDLDKRINVPPPWRAYKLLQYTGDGVGPLPHTVPGLEDGADLNAFHGNRDDLAAIWPGAIVPVRVAAKADNWFGVA